MLKYKKLENNMIEVTSTIGMVDIGEGAVNKIICDEAEKEYITEIPNPETNQTTK